MPIPALLLLADAGDDLTAQSLVTRMRTDWADELDGDRLTARPGFDGAFSIEYGDQVVAVGDVPELLELDLDLLDFLCENSVSWDDVPAPDDVTAQKLIFVTVPDRDEQGVAPTHEQAVADFTLLTRAISSATAVADGARAVFHQTSSQVTPPEIYREVAISDDWQLLLKVWVAINLTEGPEDTLNAFTAGMAELALSELELLDSPLPVVDTYELVDGIVEYLYENGPVIGDGDSIAADDLRLRVTEGASVVDPEETVLRLTLDESGDTAADGSAPDAPQPEG